jgi:predicted nuclease with TOPRIM domain
MQNINNNYQERMDKFQQRLEELAIEKELLLSRVFTARQKLNDVKENMNRIKSQTEIKLLKSLNTIDNSI